VLLSLLAFGNRHPAREGKTIFVMDTVTGQQAEPVVVDRQTGRALAEPRFRFAAGAAAREGTRRRLESGAHSLLHCALTSSKDGIAE
jgi:hypothetical protein